MHLLEYADGFRVRGPLGWRDGRPFVGELDFEKRLSLSHADHPCESSGGEMLPCPEVEIDVRYRQVGAA